ncbi:geranylgeranyl transferase type-2 subunit alpha [Eurytemora carolleeae]|uniref:geranylgeranyl transferase type-2 subunit alpha n=1 Tax=Eurytemora carolleeae TaxID=1294199 RepID=UPI000C78249F|nr:geranylgeranyl transferase type-2 subunit alpha [Eurytemora carolleeae]|eukprot:XP_023322947.1 geranylgeranyl transferase type-2 subunit alpha-like [Eurytemora affinis]
MHGRVKVKTTEQQEKEKKIERDAKLAAYRKAMGVLLSRRAEGKLDDQQLVISGQVLQGNPDISTLWNIRKEILLHYINLGTQKEKDVGEGEKGQEEVDCGKEENVPMHDQDEMLSSELDLTQQCLIANPKSYGAWHHRTWCLEHMINPDWSRELALCRKFLKLDERNFHCWDYRKWVADKAGVKPQQELEFTLEKIEENFSNYSAWHYRSKLLPLLNPDTSSIQEDQVHKELDLVQNAAFTDPADSSAWFYHTWLLGQESEGLKIVFCMVEDGWLTVSLTSPVPRAHLVVKVDGLQVELDWQAGQAEQQGNRFLTLWKAKLISSPDSCLEISISNSSVTFSIRGGERQIERGEGWKSQENRFVNKPNFKTNNILKQALGNCEDLLELEPDSKWTLYTKVLILLNLDSRETHEEIISCLKSLREIDFMRRNFYADLELRLTMEFKIESGNINASDLFPDKYHAQYLPALTQKINK